MKYIANDGKIFESKDKCVDHENELKAQEEKKVMLAKVEEKRWEEVEQAKKTYDELYQKYVKDYSKLSYTSSQELFHRLFNFDW